MYDDEIEALNEWFDDKQNRMFDTYRNDEDGYSVSYLEVDDFCDFLRENTCDLVGIQCMVGTDGIWFTREQLDSAQYY